MYTCIIRIWLVNQGRSFRATTTKYREGNCSLNRRFVSQKAAITGLRAILQRGLKTHAQDGKNKRQLCTLSMSRGRVGAGKNKVSPSN